MTPISRKTIAGISLSAIALAVIATFLVRPTTAADEKSAIPAKPALTVSVTTPVSASLAQKLIANGSVAAWQEAIIGSEVNGLRLVEVYAAIGDNVAAGQVLAVFASEAVVAEVAQARAAVAEADANAQSANADALRAKSLQGSGALSAQQLQQYATADLTAQARLESAKANLATAQLRLKHVQVVAPDAGVISARSATVGAVAAPGTELFRMIRQGRLEWRAEVTGDELGRLQRGQTANLIVANGTSSTQIKGIIRAIAPTIDPQTRTALVYVDLKERAGQRATVSPGMFAKGEFEIGSSQALTLPQQAIVVRDGFSYVFVLNQQQRVAQQKVKVGRRIADQVEVLEGITPNASIVTTGAGFLSEGDLVKVATGAAAPTTKK